MNLTLIFIVLSCAIGYMLYDTFKKSRQNPNQQGQPVAASRIKTNYATQCKILKDLHEQKFNFLKLRSISIHLNQQKRIAGYKEKEAEIVQKNLKILSKTTKIYILINSTKAEENQVISDIRKAIPPEQFIPYKSIEGAVAILRQLNCHLHLQGEEKLLKIMKQYTSNIWFSGKDDDGSAKHVFTNEVDMFKCLEKLIEAYEKNPGKIIKNQ